MEPIGDIRPMMRKFFHNYQKKNDLIGVEIGTQRGINAKNILQNFDMKKLYLIDPYIKYEEYTEDLIGDAYDTAKNNLQQYMSRIEFIYKKSEEAVNDVQDNLDFVYIDGNHAYEYVKRDVELYYPKVITGGYIGGHDFDIKYPGVVKAVKEFVRKHDMTNRWFHHNDWLIVKEEEI